MKLRFIHFIAAALLLFCVLPADALIVLGGDEGHTNAPPDDPGWNAVGYVRGTWPNNTSRASGVYIGDGWVLTAYHVIYFDAPNGIVFNAEPGTEYPVDTSSYVRLDTNSFTRFADSPYWENPENFLSSSNTTWTSPEWSSILTQIAPNGADLAMFRLQEGHYPDIEPIHISEIWSDWLSNYLSWFGFGKEVTAIATGRPLIENPTNPTGYTYWTTNLTEIAEGSPDAVYYGYKHWPDTTYNPICRWGKNDLLTDPYGNIIRTVVDRAPFGKTICVPTFFGNYDSGGTSNTFQMAGLDSGGGVFYKGSGNWELLGLLTAKQLPNGVVGTDLEAHPFESYSLICDLSYYREQIMRVTEWPDISVQLLNATNIWAGVGQPISFSILTTNITTNSVPTAFTNTLVLTHNGQTNQVIQIEIPALNAGESHTYPYSFTPNSPGAWKFSALADSEHQVIEILEQTDDSNDQGFKQNNEAFKTFYVGPDLRIIEISPTLTNAIAGSQIPLQVISTNQGIDDASATFEISYYLTTNDVFVPLSEEELEAIEAGPKISVNGLAAGATITNTLEVTAPAPTGRYFMRARIDSAANIDEAVEDNNWGPRCEIRVGPDLIITDASPRTITAAAGAAADLDITIRNQGAANITETFKTGLYVVNLQTGEGTKLPQWATATEGLAAGASTTFTATVTVPTATGTYYLTAQVDDYDSTSGEESAVDESIENNNTGILGQTALYGSVNWPKSSILYVEDMYTVVTNNGAITITDYHGSGGDVNIPRTINGLPVTEIGNSAFAYATNLTGITMPDTVTVIADQAFQSCTALTNVVLSTNLTTLGYGGIGAGAFRECISLTSITIPSSVTSMQNWAFADCTSLTRVIIKNNLIGYGMFTRCSNLTTITVPDSVTSVGDWAFGSCTGLKSIYFLGDAPSIGGGGTNLFLNVTSAVIYYSPGGSGWNATWGGLPTALFPYSFTIANETVTITGYGGSGGDIIIPSIIADLPVINISANAFASCTNIVSITIPATVTSIGDQAFANCIGLRNVYFLGNAPIAGINIFNNSPGRIYYLPGAAGWPTAPDTWAGLPTKVWNPVIEIGGAPGDMFQFEFSWSSGMVVVVEARTNLTEGVWVPMETNTLDNSTTLFSDPQSTNYPGRFYRIRTEL